MLFKAVQWVLGGAAVLAAMLLLIAPPVPEWGEHHLPHADNKFLRLRDGEAVSQHFLFEHDRADLVVVWLEPGAVPKDGELSLQVSTGQASAEAHLITDRVAVDGLVAFNFSEPVAGRTGERAELRLTYHGPEAVQVAYQIDGSIYEPGELAYHPNLRKVGDLAWRIRYQRPALGSTGLSAAYATVLVLTAASIIAAGLTQANVAAKPSGLARREWLLAVGVGIGVLLLYAGLLLRPGVWLSPSDFSKDVSYVAATVESVQAGTWPTWSHITCGGMSLAGNPEGNSFSVATLFALVTSAETGLWLTLILEAGVAAAGMYLLARLLGLSRLSGLMAVGVVAVSASMINKLALGFSMLGGIWAATPWALLFLILAQRRSSWPWAYLAGLALTFAFWRGDAHAILGAFALLGSWSVWEAVRQRNRQPFIPLLIIVALFFLGASVKILPYLEQPSLISTKLDPHVFVISAERHYDDMLLRKIDPTQPHTVRHGVGEGYGYQGMYLGYLVLGLVVLGVLWPSRYRWPVLLSGLVLLVLLDGYLYDAFLRHVDLFKALLRMPSRLTIVWLPLVGLLAGAGLDVLRRRFKVPTVIASIVVLVALVDLGSGLLFSWQAGHFIQRTTQLPSRSAKPTLAKHVGTHEGDTYLASQLLAGGYLLPQVCGDQNNPAAFTRTVESPKAISEQPVTLSPARMTVETHSGEPTVVDARFVASWQPDHGVVLPADNGGLRLPAGGVPVNLHYQLATKRAQQVLFSMILIVFAGAVIAASRRSPSSRDSDTFDTKHSSPST